MCSKASDPIEVCAKESATTPNKLGDCPFSQRVLLTLEEKHLPYDLKLVDLRNKPEWFLNISPEGKVPLIKLDEKWIPDSDVITQALEDKFPEPPLATPAEKATVGSKIFSTFIGFLKSKDSSDGTEQALLSELDDFNGYLEENGPFINGKVISAADLSLAPKLYHLEIALGHYKKWPIPTSLTYLSSYMKTIFSMDSFVKTGAQPEDVIEGWRPKVEGVSDIHNMAPRRNTIPRTHRWAGVDAALNEHEKAVLCPTQGTIDVQLVKDLADAGYHIPEVVREYLNEKFPSLQIPIVQLGENEENRIVADVAENLKKRRAEAQGKRTSDEGGSRVSMLDKVDDYVKEVYNVSSDSEDNEEEATEVTGAGVKKRSFDWLTDVSSTRVKKFNKRDENGSLLPLTDKTRFENPKLGKVFDSGKLPDEYCEDSFYEFWEFVRDINGTPFYDKEEAALGVLKKTEFLILPAEMDIPICPAEDIGAGLCRFKLSGAIIAAVYALAKVQAKKLGYSEEKAIVWATLRLEMVKAGWYAKQKQVVREPTPSAVFDILRNDGGKIKELLPVCWKLNSFVPFVTEIFFRQTGGVYDDTNPNDYTAVAEKLAGTCGMMTHLTIMEYKALFGPAFRWIGVKRVKDALKTRQVLARLPEAFKLRLTTPPAGMALITTSEAAISHMHSANWWNGVKKAGEYDDHILISTAAKIKENPWKYHIMSYLYEEPPLSAEENTEVDNAKAKAIIFAPILQAFIDAILPQDALSKAKALRKHAESKRMMMERAKGFFLKVYRRRIEDIEELFLTEVFLPEKEALKPRRQARLTAEEVD